MNLFFTRLTGKLMTTEKFEKHIRQLLADAKRYHEIENSDLLKEYLGLEKTVSETRFQEKKREYQTKRYQDTVEYKNHQEYLTLRKDKTVRKYMAATTDEERQSVEGSIAVKNFLQLQSIVEQPDFEERRAFWADKKRWNLTPEYKQEQRYNELKKDKDLQFYFKAPKKRIEEMESWMETFKAPFHEASLEKNFFTPGFWFKKPELKRDFSYAEEAQAYMGDKNVNIQEDVMSIITKKQHVEATVWNAKKGFITKPFEYTSSVVTTGDTFHQAEGLFMAKVRASGKCHSAIFLAGEDRLPLIELFHYNGRNVVIGTTGQKERHEEVLRGINTNDWLIVSVLVSKHEVVWLLNEIEVFRTKNVLAEQPLHFCIQSYAPANKPGEGRIDVDWVRAFKKA